MFVNSNFASTTKCVQSFSKTFDLSDFKGYTIDCNWSVNAAYNVVIAQASGVDTTDDFVTSAAHTFVTGQKVRVSSSTTLPTGLSAATDYWVIALTANTFAFATTLANADAGTKIDITAVGTGNLTVTNSLAFLSTGETNATDDTITLRGHGLTTGEVFTVTTTGTIPVGLVAVTPYYAIVVDLNTIKVASSLVNANAGTPVDITGVGVGAHAIVLTALASAGVKTDKSNGGVTFFAEETSVAITTTGSNLFGKTDVYSRYVKMTVTMASGNIAFNAYLTARG